MNRYDQQILYDYFAVMSIISTALLDKLSKKAANIKEQVLSQSLAEHKE